MANFPAYPTRARNAFSRESYRPPRPAADPRPRARHAGRAAGRTSAAPSATAPLASVQPVQARHARVRSAGASARRTRGSTVPVGRIAVRAVLAVALLVVVGAVAFYGARGWSLYQEAAARTTPEEMAAAVRAVPGYTGIDQLPQTYLDAVVAVEDHRFYRHPGFDAIATTRALANDLRALSVVEGGSTITQQLAKNQFFTQDQTIERKVAEVLMAFDLERHFSKQEILELYVNSIYFGDGLYGVAAASEGYFGKAPSQLTDYEATMLAGIPNAPSAYAPTANPDLAAQRQEQVLEKMEEYRMVDSAEADAIRAEAA